MIQCAEFSFKIRGRTGSASLFFDNEKGNVAHIESIRLEPESDYVMLTPNLGGRIKDLIESHYGKEFDCPFCSKTHPCKRWRGNEHSGGIPDKDGTKYWMTIKCLDDDNHLSLRKIAENLRKPKTNQKTYRKAKTSSKTKSPKAPRKAKTSKPKSSRKPNASGTSKTSR